MAKDEEEKLQYLKEHVTYERTMLGYTYARLHDTAPGIGWNVVYESFGIHARNLYDFLRNDGSGGTTFRANDYVANWRSPDYFASFNVLDYFVFHMSSRRTSYAKLTLEQLQQLGLWLNTEWANWVGRLPSPYNEIVTPEPICKSPTLQAGVTSATACTTFSFTSTSNEADIAAQDFKPFKD